MTKNNDNDKLNIPIETNDPESAESEEIIDDSADKLLRLRAEFDNFRKRSRKDIVTIRKNAMNEFVRELIPVISNLERAVEESDKNLDEEYSSGFKLILDQLKELNVRYGVEEINPEGELFDPLLHEAFMVQEDNTVKPNTVIQVLEKGYRCGDNLLKAARVIVSKETES